MSPDAIQRGSKVNVCSETGVPGIRGMEEGYPGDRSDGIILASPKIYFILQMSSDFNTF